MKIFELEESEIKKGMRVWNVKRTKKGTITDLDPDTRDGLMVYITWDDGGDSSWWAFG